MLVAGGDGCDFLTILRKGSEFRGLIKTVDSRKHLYIDTLTQEITQLSPRDSSWFNSSHFKQLLPSLRIVNRRAGMLAIEIGVTGYSLKQLRPKLERKACRDVFSTPMDCHAPIAGTFLVRCGILPFVYGAFDGMLY